ncbi:MAG TPA: zinc-ribbon domain containing protein [Candidatus Limnocylindrales bacterium]|nr:zinc-ribbon domain containing protein [Candidatus Limnocylindrales bacterium]
MFTDRAINCADCGQEFTFTAGEQEFYEQRGFTEPPKRCGSCRAARKSQRQSSSHGDGNGGSYGGYAGGGYSSDAGGSYGERPQREMFDATCAECGRTARVPFRPTGARPVYCSDCFQSRR